MAAKQSPDEVQEARRVKDAIRDTGYLNERKRIETANAEKTARLRTLRLAKEATEREAAQKEAAERDSNPLSTGAVKCCDAQLSSMRNNSMRTPIPQFRFRAVSMELAAHLEERRVDMLIVTEDGTTLAIECGNDTILNVQRHIEQISRDCPQIASWGDAKPAASSQSNTENNYDAAVSEGWRVMPSPTSLQ